MFINAVTYEFVIYSENNPLVCVWVTLLSLKGQLLSYPVRMCARLEPVLVMDNNIRKRFIADI